MSWASAFTVVGVVAGCAVMWAEVCTLNAMTRRTRLVTRLAHVLIGVGTAAVVLTPCYLGRAPSHAEILLLSGLALLALVRKARWLRLRRSRS